jgi:hypothetical protein
MALARDPPRLCADRLQSWESAAYYVPQADLVVANADNLFLPPVGDLGTLRDVLRAYSSS